MVQVNNIHRTFFCGRIASNQFASCWIRLHSAETIDVTAFDDFDRKRNRCLLRVRTVQADVDDCGLVGHLKIQRVSKQPRKALSCCD
ncbi:hypothetical protein D3C81_2178380 [compost metagenome]